MVLAILLAGCLFALPNLYGSVEAVQVADGDGGTYDDVDLAEFVQIVEQEGVTPEAAYLQDGRAVIRFNTTEDQERAGASLKAAFPREANVAMTLAPKLPEWVRKLGLKPMSLGLDLRGGVYVLLEVDMATAIESRMKGYQQDFDDRLREARIRHRVDLADGTLSIRLTSAEDVQAARAIVERADQDVLVSDGADGRSLTVRMSEAQIKERQDFAIEQNLTTLRNRVNQLGVAEPLVQRQGVDRIVVQLPGVQDPNQLKRILTATATLEFRLVDQSGDEPGSRRYPGRGDTAPQVLKRQVIASGDQIIDARTGSDQGQVIVSITLDSAAGERMLETTIENLNRPMSTVFIESRRDNVMRNGVEEQGKVTRLCWRQTTDLESILEYATNGRRINDLLGLNRNLLFHAVAHDVIAPRFDEYRRHRPIQVFNRRLQHALACRRIERD